jgi:OOP family OmpA-OmpF porin
MKPSIKAACALLITTLPIAALADDGFFVGASIGSATLTDDFDGFDVDADSSAYRLVFGYQFSDAFGLEAGYHRFGTFEENRNFSFDADGVFLGGNVGVPLSDSFRLFARGGAFFWDGDSVINTVTRATPDDSNLYLGAGASVAITEQLSLVGDWTRYELQDTDSDVISIGFTLRF